MKKCFFYVCFKYSQMNRLILFICFTVLLQNTAFSDCIPMKFWVWPERDTLSRNPLIVFNFYERSLSGFTRTPESSQIRKDVSFFLRSTSGNIPLKLIQQNVGQSNEKQLIFKPLRLLKPNTEYELSFSCADSASREEFLEDIGFKTKTWITNEVIDKKAPVWISKPQFWYKNYRHYGCGPESYWCFCMTIKDESAVLVQTIVRHLESGKVSEYYLHPDSNSVFVGYGMCRGEFDMIPGDRYSVSFNLVDESGNSGNQFSDPLFVQAPFESESISDEELEQKKCPCDSGQTAGEKDPSISLGWILGIVGIIVLIACANGYRNYRRV
ncbi:hypothetical protein D3C87_06220 [compost metagenome]